MFFVPKNVDEINEIVSKMTSKTNQLYDIPINILTSIISKTFPVLVKFYNKFIMIGIYPNEFKLARIVSVYKASSSIGDLRT